VLPRVSTRLSPPRAQEYIGRLVGVTNIVAALYSLVYLWPAARCMQSRDEVKNGFEP
jgi:hypothetical protein